MSLSGKERDRERPRGTVTTVRRYRVPDRVFEDDPREEEVRVVRREREPERREYRYDRDYDERDIVIRRKEVDQLSSPRVEEWRIERDVGREREPPKRDPSYELERYSRSTEYYARPEPQPPIIIRQEPQPIIIQEAPRQEVILRREEPQYEIIERSEAPEPPKPELQVARKEPPKEENYYYERRVREVDRGPRRDDYYDERERDYRRDVGLRDSASRYGDAYSDDDLVVVRRERTDSEYGGRGRSPHHAKHLAEGALAGAGIAALVGHHRSKQGHEESHTGRNVVGGAALGAVGAAVVTRGKDWWEGRRSQSRSRERRPWSRERRSWSREWRPWSRERRPRSKSPSRIKTLAGLGAVAAIGALAGYAARGNQQEPERRSRSRRRRHSVSGARQRSLSEEKHLDPGHRNRRIAQAGLASAAVAGLVEHARSRSRPGRERSRIRTGVPIAATALGGAALAGLYERNQARKASEERKSRSRSRSVARSERSGGRRGSEPGMIEYGQEPIYLETRGRRNRGSPDSRSSGSPARYRRRSGSSRSHSRSRHLAETAAIAGAAGVAAHEAGKRRERKRLQKERKRHEKEARQDSYEQDYDPRAYDPTPAGGVPLGGYPADRYYPNTNQFPPPPPPTNPYAPPEPVYANPSVYVNAAPYDAGQYAPPPTGQRDFSVDPYAYQGPEGAGMHNGTYYPDGIPPPTGQRRNISPDYSYSPPPREHQLHEGDRDDGNGRRGDDNVSDPPYATTPEHSDAGGGSFNDPLNAINANVSATEGLKTPRQRSPRGLDGTREQAAKNVQFDLAKDKERRRRRRRKHKDDDDGRDGENGRNRHRRERQERGDGERDDATGERRGEGRDDERLHRHSRSESAASDASGETVELPRRFDEQGRKIPERGEDRIADKLEDFLNGKGTAGRLFQRLRGDLSSRR